MDNLPDGMSVYDSRAPWNQPEPQTCADCKYYCDASKTELDLDLDLCLQGAIEHDLAIVNATWREDYACCDFEPRD